MRMLLLIPLLIAFPSIVTSARYEGTTDCDFVRSNFVQLEKSQWDRYVNKDSILSQNERLYKIINQQFLFVKQHMQYNYTDQDFEVLQRFYEWNVIEPDVKSVHSLFRDHFVKRLETELDNNNSNGGVFNERALLDLAETVIEDPLWRINSTMEKIQNNIYNQGLYYKAKAVLITRQIFHSLHNNIEV